MGYSIEYLGVVTLPEYSDVYGDVVKLGGQGKNLEFEAVRRKTLWSIDVLLIYLHLFGCELSGN